MNETQTTVDLTNCDKEPIHIPGSVQPHGILFVLAQPDTRVVQFSANAPAVLELSTERLHGTKLSDYFLSDELDEVISRVYKNEAEGQHRYVCDVVLRSEPSSRWEATVHRWKGFVFAELERENSEGRDVLRLQSSLRATINDLDTCESLSSFCQSAAEHFRRLTGFDRVMIYRFLSDGSGVVIAEDRAEEMDSYMDLRYPASDIPVQARQLYLLNAFRLTADVNARPAALVPPINPLTNAPLDMSFCALRATSPVHLEYLRNMGVAASLSWSIVNEGKLWGLVACHHRQSKSLPQDVRLSGEILAKLVSLQVALKQDAEHRSYETELQRVRAELGTQLAHSGDFIRGLLEGEPNLLSGLRASGVALYTGSRVFTIGECPRHAQIEQLCHVIRDRPWRPVYATHNLTSELDVSAEVASVASGLLMVRIAENSPEAVLWFRPEVIRTVNWAGNPEKPAEVRGDSSRQLHPRRSFALWKEQVRGESVHWQPAELEHAEALQKSLAQALLQHRAQEILRLNSELTRKNHELDQFATIASHDLQEPLRTITTYTQLFLRNHVASAGPEATEIGELITGATRRMSALTVSLLEFARSGRSQESLRPVPSQVALQTALKSLQASISESGATVTFGELPDVIAEAEQLARVFQNLIANAIKFRRRGVAPEVHVEASRKNRKVTFSIRDNGTGFDPSYAQMIFQSFERLHGRQYEGSGLGLAICRKIIESCNGRIWAESEPGVGSVFSFSLEGA